MVNELQMAFDEIAELRALPPDVVLEALQSALVSAYRRDSQASSAQAIEARIDPATGRARIFVEKEVTEDVFSPDTEVTLEKARFYDPEAQLGDTVMVQVEHTTKSFGRIAAQTAKQVILQKIREAERDALYSEFIEREGDLMFGLLQSQNHQVATLRLNDRAEAILPRSQQIPGERLPVGDRVRVFIMEVKKTSKGPQIVCSRSHRGMLRRLLQYEVPEIANGQVEIKSIAREAGQRSKVAVVALQDGIDPVGACVGMRGIRIQNIVKELHNEKIDVIEWNSDPEVFISKALSPARVTGVYLDDDPHSGRTAIVVVPDDQLSLAIGREGQNARLAAKLTGWRIDIKSVTETVAGALQNLDVPPLDVLAVSHAKLIEDVRTIIAKRDNNRAIMPEEFTTLGKFANLVEKRLQRLRDEMRDEERQQIAAVRATLPEAMFEVPVDVLGLDEPITEALNEVGTVGDIMLALLTDEVRLRRALSGIELEDGRHPLTLVQQALDELMESDVAFEDLVPETDEPEVTVAAETTPETEVEIPEPVEAVVEDIVEEAVEAVDLAPEAEEAAEDVAAEVEPVAVPELDVVAEPDQDEEEEEVLLDAFGGIVREEPEQGEEPEPEVAFEEFDEFNADDEIFEAMDPESKKSKKDRRKRRRLVYDEESGEVVAKRRRKRGRRRDEWEDEIDF